MVKTKKANKKTDQSTAKVDPLKQLKRPFLSIKQRWQDFRKRRPHRTFQLTRRRDYKQKMTLPGYWALTTEVSRLLWDNKKLFICFTLFYAVISVGVIGLMSNSAFSEFRNTLSAEYELFGINLNGVVETASLVGATMMGMFAEPLTESQQIIGGISILLAWMTMVWLLRQILAGHKVKLRDGLYSSGSPFIATFIIFLVIIIQLLPVALGLIVYSVLTASGIATQGVEAMLAWTAIILLAVMSLYWITSSIVALVIVTLPGMYPFAALKQAGDIVVGRRLRVMLRLLWSVVILLVAWAVLLAPAVIIQSAINIDWLPILPLTIALLSALTLVWFSAYAYLLYRRLIDEFTAST